MKKATITILILISCIICSHGQLAVADAGLTALMIKQMGMRTQSNVTIAKQLVEAGQQTKKLSDTYKLMKDASEKLNKISSFISNVNMVANILSNQKYQYERIKTASERLKDSKYVTANELRRLQSCSSRFVKNSSELVAIVNRVVTPGKAEMNDAERINLLMKLNEKIISETCAIDFTIKSLEDIEAERRAVCRSQDVLKEVFTGNN